MLQLGRKLIYDKVTGNGIFDTGEKEGYIRQTSIEEDYPSYEPVTMSYLELIYGYRKSEFENSLSFHVDPITKELIITQG